MSIANATCQAPTNVSATGFTDVCTMSATVGIDTVTISSGNAIIDNTNKINVTQPIIANIISNPPVTLFNANYFAPGMGLFLFKSNTTTTLTVTGQNLPTGLGLWMGPFTVNPMFGSTTCQAPTNSTLNGFTQVCTFGTAINGNNVGVYGPFYEIPSTYSSSNATYPVEAESVSFLPFGNSAVTYCNSWNATTKYDGFSEHFCDVAPPYISWQ